MKEYRLRVKEKIMKADLATIRREYTKGGLKRSDLPDNPLVLFTKWLQEAIDAEVNEPTAMLVGTVSPEGKPAIRTVLLKDLHDGKFIFYTNYKPQNKMFRFYKTFCSRITLINTNQNVILNPI